MLDVTKNVKFTGLTPNVPVASTGESVVNTVSIPTQKPDEFVKQGEEEKKKKLSTGAKVGIGAGILATAGLIAFLVMKCRVSEAKQLAEHIEFKPAQTIEEAIKFGKEHLGIKSYEDFGANDLDAINWLNEGFVNVSNYMKGKLRMPKHVVYTDKQFLGKNTLAGVVPYSQDLSANLKKYSGYFYVNKKYFSDYVKSVNKDIDRALGYNLLWKNENGKIKVNSLYTPETSKFLISQIEEFQKTQSFNSALKVTNTIDNMYSAFNSYEHNPLNTIKALLGNKDNTIILKKAGININMEEIQMLSLKEQQNIRSKMLAHLVGINELDYVNNLISKDKEYAKKLVEQGFIEKPEAIKKCNFTKLSDIIDFTEKYEGKNLDFLPIRLRVENLDKTTPFSTIYHEMGHLQDMKPRCLTTDKCGYDISKYSQELKDWVNNEDNIRIANNVSEYASHGPGEFIAETFAKLVEGRKVSQEVKDLYKKLGGPEIPNM